jgi:hypothetical protein
MSSAFLDNGVVIAYCFTIHEHHPECDDFVERDDIQAYITQDVDDIFDWKTTDVAKELSTDILEHQADIKRGSFPDELGPTDLRDCRKMIHSKNDARRFLLNWYDDEVGQFIGKYELTERLRNLAEDIESRALTRKEQLDQHVEVWNREDEYTGIQDSLSEVREEKEEDMWICIDAHDLADNKSGETILATTDPGDFIRDGRKELILGATALDDIKPIGNLVV